MSWNAETAANAPTAAELETAAALQAAAAMAEQPAHHHSQPEESREQDLQAEIQEIDAALANMAAVSPTFEAICGQLSARREQAKREITLAKPLHVQVETCRGAAARASKRATAAREAKLEAQQKLNDAAAAEQQANQDMEVKRAELRRLEQQVLSQMPPLAAAAPTQGGDSLTRLRASMGDVMTDLQHGSVGTNVVGEAQHLMDQLISGLSLLQATSQQRHQQTAPTVLEMLGGVRGPISPETSQTGIVTPAASGAPAASSGQGAQEASGEAQTTTQTMQD